MASSDDHAYDELRSVIDRDLATLFSEDREEARRALELATLADVKSHDDLALCRALFGEDSVQLAATTLQHVAVADLKLRLEVWVRHFEVEL